ncbi:MULTISPECIES: hypothetical protein [unclassified Dysgonomonas]|uniref:hypothetical protein n=1 Tax=unclassified Dysgonomonas TaxID=2630389 RepID=UPI0025C699D5|nr:MULTISPECIES: hypothetical protein [unclassified Dysgonomonas]HMM01715.1 hypothetical protein [Dysgonomonas sp.]
MGLFDFFRKKKQVTEVTDEDRRQFAEDMQANANALVNQFKDVALLDFSVDSLQLLDEIMEENTSFYKRGDNETKRIMIIKIGAYIFEVARQNFGGQYYWYDKLDQPVLVTGQPEFEMSLLAYEKVKGRFENGSEDNIPFFFAGYVEGVKEKKNAMIV